MGLKKIEVTKGEAKSKAKTEREANPATVEKIMAVFRRTKPDGEYYYSSEDVEHWIPIMLITLGDPSSTWTAENKRIFLAFLDKVGIPDMNDGKSALAKIRAYYKKHPVNAELMQELSAVAVNVKLDANDETLRRASKVLQSTKAMPTTTQGGLVPPNAAKKKPRR